MEPDILRFLYDGAATGDEVRVALGVDTATFYAAARTLWVDGLVQGELADGCCSAPCGTMCVSAMRVERVWQLSKKGRLRMKVLQAKGLL